MQTNATKAEATDLPSRRRRDSALGRDSVRAQDPFSLPHDLLWLTVRDDEADGAFTINTTTLGRWQQESGRADPRLRSTDVVESGLGWWLLRLRGHRSRRDPRVRWRDGWDARLSALLPSWPTLPAGPSFADGLGALLAWVKEHPGTIPRRTTLDPEQDWLARWLEAHHPLSTMQHRASSTDHMMRALTSACPGWDTPRTRTREGRR